MTVGDFRRSFPLGSTTRVVLLDAQGHYAGIVVTAAAHADVADVAAPVAQLASNRDRFIDERTDIVSVMKAFDAAQTDELAVVDQSGAVLGILSETFVRKRYAEELERHHRELYGER
jgi:CIC family chloride channel protein